MGYTCSKLLHQNLPVCLTLSLKVLIAVFITLLSLACALGLPISRFPTYIRLNLLKMLDKISCPNQNASILVRGSARSYLMLHPSISPAPARPRPKVNASPTVDSITTHDPSDFNLIDDCFLSGTFRNWHLTVCCSLPVFFQWFRDQRSCALTGLLKVLFSIHTGLLL